MNTAEKKQPGDDVPVVLSSLRHGLWALNRGALAGFGLALLAGLGEGFYFVAHGEFMAPLLVKAVLLSAFTLLLPLMLAGAVLGLLLSWVVGPFPWGPRLSRVFTAPATPSQLLGACLFGLPLVLALLVLHDHVTAWFVTFFRPPESAAPVLLMAEYALLLAGLVVLWLFARLLARPVAALDTRLSRRLNARVRTLVGISALLIAVFAVWTVLIVRIAAEFDAIEQISIITLFLLQLVLVVLVPASLLRPSPPRRWAVLTAYILACALLISGPALSRDSLLLAGLQNYGPSFRMISPLYLSLADPDGDQFPSLMGGRDTAPFDPWAYPGAPEIPGNGIDDNCLLGDPPADYVPPRDPRFVTLPKDWRDKDFNILLITVDALRWDHLPFNGYHRDTAPRLTELVRESVNFSRAYTQGTGTILSIPSYMSGLYTAQMRCTNLHMEPDLRRPFEGVEFLPDYLRTRGYHTSLFSSTHYLKFFSELDWDLYSNPPDKMAGKRDVTSDEITDRAISKLKTILPRYKTFAWLHYYDPHDAYVVHPGEKSFGTSKKDLYDGEIHFTDKHIGRLLDAWRAMSPLPTVIIISADHGESLGEHGIPYHNMNFYDSIVRVPLILHLPGAAPATVDEPVALLDIVPTLRNLLGDEPHPDHFGRSLLGEVLHGARDPERHIFHSAQFRQFRKFFAKRGISGKRYKFMWDLVTGSEELYDIETDPSELRNLLGTDSAMADLMRGRLHRTIEDVGVTAPVLNNCDYCPPTGLARHYPPPREGMTDGYILDALPDTAKPHGEIVFGNPPAVRLLHYDITPTAVREDRRVTVRLYFEKLREVTENPLIFVHLRGARGGLRRFSSNYDHWPVQNLLPIPDWPLGRIILDEFSFPAPSGLGSGDLTLFVGLWNHATRRRMVVHSHTKNFKVDDHRIRLGSIRAHERPLRAKPVRLPETDQPGDAAHD